MHDIKHLRLYACTVFTARRSVGWLHHKYVTCHVYFKHLWVCTCLVLTSSLFAGSIRRYVTCLLLHQTFVTYICMLYGDDNRSLSNRTCMSHTSWCYDIISLVANWDAIFIHWIMNSEALVSWCEVLIDILHPFSLRNCCLIKESEIFLIYLFPFSRAMSNLVQQNVIVRLTFEIAKFWLSIFKTKEYHWLNCRKQNMGRATFTKIIHPLMLLQ